MRQLLIVPILIAAIFAACGDDDGGNGTTAPASATAEGSPEASGTLTPSPAPTPTIALMNQNDVINAGHPLVLAVAANYLGLLPPVSFTNPIACEGINEKYDEATEAERAIIDQENVGRICILLSQSTFEAESAAVFVGYYRSDVGETLNMELRDGAWVIASVTTQEPI